MRGIWAEIVFRRTPQVTVFSRSKSISNTVARLFTDIYSSSRRWRGKPIDIQLRCGCYRTSRPGVFALEASCGSRYLRAWVLLLICIIFPIYSRTMVSMQTTREWQAEVCGTVTTTGCASQFFEFSVHIVLFRTLSPTAS